MPCPNLPKLPPPNFPSFGTRIKRVVVGWITLLIMEEGGCSLTFAKFTNPKIVNAAAKSSCITHPLN